MDNLQDKTVFELASRLNEIDKEIRQLEIEHNCILQELYQRIPKLEGDQNLQPKVLRKIREVLGGE